MTKPTSSDDVDSDFEAYLATSTKSDAWLARMFIALGVVALIVMSGIYGYFNVVGAADLDVDLWLAADRSARPGALLLVEASSRDPKTGKELYRPDLYLEQWEGSERTASWPIQGELRRSVQMGAVPLRFRVAVPDRRIGEQAAEVTVTPAITGDVEGPRERVGGAKPPLGAAGLHAVRAQGTCGWNVEAVALGGVPVAHLENTVLFRVTDEAGEPVEGARLLPGESSAVVKTRTGETDADGVAVFAMRLDELAYVELRAACGEGAQLWGFEVHPVYYGLVVESLTWSSDGLAAEVARVSVEQDAFYDVRCEGELVKQGSLARSGELQVPGDAFARYGEGTRCVFQVYRGTFGVSDARSVRPFLLGSSSLGWLWAQHARGVEFSRGGGRVQASEAGGLALAAWKEQAFGRIRALMSVVLGSSLLLWLVVTVLSVRGRRRALARLSHDDEFGLESGLTLRWLPLLLLGWSGIVLMLGGMWFVLWLMGL